MIYYLEMECLSNILHDRIESFNSNPEKSLKLKSTEYNKKWNEGVKCFQTEINKEREVPISFMAVRSKLLALREVDDLRYFFGQCKAYSKTKDKKTGKKNSFGRIFFGALKV